jgi:hypothetical protein
MLVPYNSMGLGTYQRQIEATFSALVFVVGLLGCCPASMRTPDINHIGAKMMLDATEGLPNKLVRVSPESSFRSRLLYSAFPCPLVGVRAGFFPFCVRERAILCCSPGHRERDLSDPVGHEDKCPRFGDRSDTQDSPNSELSEEERVNLEAIGPWIGISSVGAELSVDYDWLPTMIQADRRIAGVMIFVSNALQSISVYFSVVQSDLYLSIGIIR